MRNLALVGCMFVLLFQHYSVLGDHHAEQQAPNSREEGLGRNVESTPRPGEEASMPGGNQGAGIQSGRGKISSKDLGALQRTYRQAAALSSIDEMIKELTKVKSESLEYKREVESHLEKIAQHIAKVHNDIKKTKKSIEDLKIAIATATAATAGLATPALTTELVRQKDKLNRLQKKAGELEANQRRFKNELGKVKDLIRSTEQKLAELENKRQQQKEKLAKVHITIPKQGARISVGKNQEIRFRSSRPPNSIELKIEKVPQIKTGSNVSSNNKQTDRPLKLRKILKWKNMESVGPDSVKFRFRAVEENVRRSIPTSADKLKLIPGKYRVGVRGDQDSEMEWLTFTVVGKMKSSSFRKGAPIKPGGNTRDNSGAASSSGDGSAGTPTSKKKLTSPFQRNH